MRAKEKKQGNRETEKEKFPKPQIKQEAGKKNLVSVFFQIIEQSFLKLMDI
jgi:hypothetical protein